jgi:hypothetical protein
LASWALRLALCNAEYKKKQLLLVTGGSGLRWVGRCRLGQNAKDSEALKNEGNFLCDGFAKLQMRFRSQMNAVHTVGHNDFPSI